MKKEKEIYTKTNEEHNLDNFQHVVQGTRNDIFEMVDVAVQKDRKEGRQHSELDRLVELMQPFMYERES